MYKSFFARQLLLGAIYTFVLLVFTGAIHAATLEFDPLTSSVKAGETFSVDITINSGTEQIVSTDIYLKYDTSLISLQSVTAGDYFPVATNTPQTKPTHDLYIAGYIVNQGEYKTGSGTVATLVFKGLATGSTNITFVCDFAATETSKVVKNDINATNSIDCSTIKPHVITIGAGTATSTTTSTTTLPQSGVLDSMLQYASYGGILLLLGIGLRVLHKVV